MFIVDKYVANLSGNFMIYERRIFKKIRENIQNKEIIVLTGMRRVGKTTALEMIFNEIKSDNKLILDIENPLDQLIFEEKDYNNIFANLKTYGLSEKKRVYLFLDEIQAMPHIIKPIKYLFDHYKLKFFLTGSSSFYLKNLFPESLAGRKIIFELFPLDFEEFLIFKKFNKTFYLDFEEKNRKKSLIRYEKTIQYYKEYLEYGGFPQVVLSREYSYKKEQLKDIFKSYFEKEVVSLRDTRNINLFRDLLLLLLGRASSKIEITKMASIIGISRETVYSYLAFLEGTYFIHLIPQYSNRINGEVRKAKKVYICDSGFLTQFAKLDEGSIIENSVFLNIKKYSEIRYYQRRSGGEIDFILTNKSIALEVKKTGTPQDIRKVKRISESLNLAKSYVISFNYNNENGFIPITEL